MIFLLTWLTESAKPLGAGVLQSQGTQRFRRDQRASGTVRYSHQLPADFPEANHRFIMIYWKWFPQLSVHLVAVQPQKKTGPNGPGVSETPPRPWIQVLNHAAGPVKMRCPAWTLGPLRHAGGERGCGSVIPQGDRPGSNVKRRITVNIVFFILEFWNIFHGEDWIWDIILGYKHR